MIVYRKNHIPLLYTQLPFIRKSAPGIVVDCLDDQKYINELRDIANGSICLSQKEADYMIVIRYDIPESILTLTGNSNELIESTYYYYKPWDVEYFIHEQMPAGAILLQEINIDSKLMYNLGEKKSCIPFLKMTSQYFQNKNNAGYELKPDILDKIKEIETKLFASYDMRKYKNISMPQKTKIRNSSISLTKRNYILQRDSYKCFFCGATSEDAKLEVNHIIPLNLIDKMNLSENLRIENFNLCTTCFDCNRGKKDNLSIKDIDYYIANISEKSENYPIVKSLELIKILQNSNRN